MAPIFKTFHGVILLTILPAATKASPHGDHGRVYNHQHHRRSGVVEARQWSDIPAYTSALVGPPHVIPPGSGQTPSYDLGPLSVDARVTAPTNSEPTPGTVPSETTTITLQPTTFSSALYDNNTMIPVASLADVPTATMPQAQPGCTPICAQVDDQGECTAVVGCAGGNAKTDAYQKGEAAGRWTGLRVAAGGLAGVAMVMLLL